MLLGLEAVRPRLVPGTQAWMGGGSHFMRAEPGEGAFRFDRITLGIVLDAMPTHLAAYGDDRRRPVPLLPGEGWILPAGLDAWCRWESAGVLNVAVDGALLNEAGLPAGFRPVAGGFDPLIAQLALHLHLADAPDDAFYRESLTMALAAQLAKTLGKPRAGTTLVDPRLRRVIDHIEAHLSDDLSLDALAGVAAMSRFHFADSFRRATGLAPYAYVVARRIAKAKVLLATTRLPVADIAWQVGYANAAKFARQFRRHAGVNPAAWRSR